MSVIKRYPIWQLVDDFQAYRGTADCEYVIAKEHDAAIETAENIAANLRNDMRDAQKQIVALEGKLTRARAALLQPAGERAPE